MNPQFHNPRNLESAGEPPWRFVLTSELERMPDDTEVWDNVNLIWKPSNHAGMYAKWLFFTYRTKEALP